jgi:hypothetical protein
MEAWHIVNWRAPALRQGDWVQAIEVDHDLGFIYQVRENPESTRVDELMKLDLLVCLLFGFIVRWRGSCQVALTSLAFPDAQAGVGQRWD